VLASYATPLGEGWQLREEDNPSARRQDLRSIRAMLEGLGKRLDYQSGTAGTAHHPLVWREDGQEVYSFYIIASAVMGALLQQAAHPGVTRCLVVPGGRAGLVSYKLERDPALRLLAEGWQLLKYRQIRLLADDLKLTRQDWQKELSADPVTDPEQMRLF
jgi:hypothetical protein